MGSCFQKSQEKKEKRSALPPTPNLRDFRSEQRTKQLFKLKASRVPKLCLEASVLYQRRKACSPVPTQTTLALD